MEHEHMEHQEFKREFIVPIAGKGTTIAAATIREWIDARRAQRTDVEP